MLEEKSKRSQASSATRESYSKQFEMKEKYDMYEMDYEEDSAEEIEEV